MSWLFLAPFLSLYFIPSVVALRRHHRNAVVIVAVNIVLGWTLLGWAVSLAWALSHNTRQPLPAPLDTLPPPPLPPARVHPSFYRE